MKTKSVMVLLWIFITCVGAGMVGIYTSIPDEVRGWKAQGKEEVYNAETLFSLINGGAELYLSYGFREAVVRRYTGPERQEISLEIYDMGTSDDAFGVFSSERQDEDVGVGQGSEYGGGLLRFWKDRFFVSLTSIGDEAQVREVMFELAQVTAKAIPDEGPEPRLVTMLPKNGLQRKTVRFFHTPSILERQYFLSNRNILHLHKGTNCVLAEYMDGGGTAHLLLVQYTGADTAREAHEDFVGSYAPEARKTGMARLENGKWVLVRRERALLVIVLDATDEGLGQRLVAAPPAGGKE